MLFEMDDITVFWFFFSLLLKTDHTFYDHFFLRFAKNSTFTFFGTFLVASKDTFSPLLVVNETPTFLGTFLVAVKLTFFLLLLLLTTFIPPKDYVLISTLSILVSFNIYETKLLITTLRNVYKTL